VVVRRADAIQFLATRGWLSVTSPSFREAVFARLVVRAYRKGDLIYRADDPPGGLWAVVRGGIEVEHSTQPMNFGRPGMWFGEAPLVIGVRRQVSVAAVQPTTMATLPLPDCRAILGADPSGWRWIALLSCALQVVTLDAFKDQLLRDPKKRAAALLLRLSGTRRAGFWPLDPSPVQLSQDKLAQILNLSRTSVVSILQGFAELGYIELKYRSILVADASGLREVVETEEPEVAFPLQGPVIRPKVRGAKLRRPNYRAIMRGRPN
jgi:CRP/FNR family cyclic AMP-dependent transcriptional regulator